MLEVGSFRCGTCSGWSRRAFLRAAAALPWVGPLTGVKERPVPVQPSFGAIVGRHRGQRGTLPPFVALGPGVPRDVVRIVEGYGGGKWGRAYDPFMINCTPEGAVEVPALRLLDGLTPL